MKFIFYFLAIFLVSFVLLYSAGLVPSAIKQNNGDTLTTLWDKAHTSVKTSGENPTRIVIDKIGVDAIVSNPNTTNTATLDDYLTQGAVRYPGSGLLGLGNMFIFGHSTGIKVVYNQAYKTFNGLKNLTVGDIIKVYGGTTIYQYRVSSVRLVDENQALVEFGGNKNMLTLSTCNTFGAKSERYVVQADYLQ